MSIDVYLNFNGNCRDAVLYYAKVFGQPEPKIMAFGDVPADPNYPMPDEAKNMVMHSRLEISGSRVMFSDVFPGMKFIEGNNVSLSLVLDNEDELRSYFQQLSDGGTVGMELQETFWSKCYGQLQDKFGIHWQFNLGDGGF
ncbi:VOC family protein [Paenibacillus gansuensis]|uniref:VOC family protein n=1 Tax=Paenibacillus gansuensis TaxID=306542 RepID=A0ABW5P7L0_9BACL